MINFQGAENHVRPHFRPRGTHLSSHRGYYLYCSQYSISGPLENVCKVCFYLKLITRSLSHRRQVVVPIVYGGKLVDEKLSLDALTKEMVICKLKPVNTIYPVFAAGPLTRL